MRLRSLLFLLSSWSFTAVAQPDFTGPRADDVPISDIFLESISEKNRDVRVPDISQAQGFGTVEIRLYEFGGITFGRDGLPIMLTRLRARGGKLDEAWLYFVCRTQGQLALADLTEAWNVLIEERFFDIPGEQVIAGYNRNVRDGAVYVVQIASFDEQRSFMLNNPAAEPNAGFPESQRFLRSLEVLKTLFPSPTDFCRQPE